MSDLADLAFDVAGDLPAQVRKTIDTAVVHGWNLNPPGMTLCLRLNHPTDDLAEPVFITWVVGRTEKTGRLSFRFDSCCTKGATQLTGADLLVYLTDPTVIYPTEEEAAAKAAEAAHKPVRESPPWDNRKSPLANAQAILGAVPVRLDPIQQPAFKVVQTKQASAAAPLKVSAPKVP